jgi:hypothetical protein
VKTVSGDKTVATAAANARGGERSSDVEMVEEEDDDGGGR